MNSRQRHILRAPQNFRGLHLSTLVTLLIVGACGGGGSDLCGSAVSEYGLSYDRILIQRQESQNKATDMKVSYLRSAKNGTLEIPVRVTVPFPVEAGREIDLVAASGTITQTTQSGAQYPELERGTITFSDFGTTGEKAAGEFFGTFKGGTTICGSFSATIELLTF